jgi:Nucleotidyl transferase AbiEii toxin, Type IV TA system
VNLLEAALRRMAADLAKYDRRWALVGGFAVSARAEPRFTRDIDVAVAVADDADGEGLVRLMLAS